TARKHADAGDRDPGLGAGDGRLEVFGEAAVASEPGEGSFDYPSFWLRLEGSDTLASRDDLDRPFSQVGDCIDQLLTAIDPVREDMAQLGERSPERFQQ